MVTRRVKIAVSGAAGQISYALLPRLCAGTVFGPECEIELQLLELESALPALEALCMELEDCHFPLLRKVTVTADVLTAMQDVDYALLIGAVPRKQGMERADLLKINGGIFGPQGKALNQVAKPQVKVLVVGNPCNTNCLITMHAAPDIPREQFFAMTALDEHRARQKLANKAGVVATAVTRLAIWGNHSTTQYPDFYNARIFDQPVIEVIPELEWLQHEFIASVQQRGAAVIQARGSSSAASAAHAVLESVRHLAMDTPEKEVFSIARCSRGEYGIDPGLIFSFPCRTKNKQLEVAADFQHNTFARAKLELTLDELRHEYNAVKTLGLLD